MIEEVKKERGITLVALVITVVVMLILAGVAISQITGEDGLLARANHATKLYEVASQNEAETINKVINMLNGDYNQDMNTGANEPKLVTGMKPVIFDESDGTARPLEEDEEWYNYEECRWANAETMDESLWVWIPRFAYKITYYTDESKTDKKGMKDASGYKKANGETVTNSGNEAENEIDTIGDEVKSNYGSIEVVFLQDTGNKYYKEENGKLILSDAVEDGCFIQNLKRLYRHLSQV